jgi:uncharacterized membrane protein YccC
MLSFLFGGFLVYIGYQSALTIVGYHMTVSNTFEDMVNRLLHWIYGMVVAVVGVFFLFGAGAEYVISFALSHALTMCFIDFEATFESKKDL